MKLTKVNALPKRSKSYSGYSDPKHDLLGFLEDFMAQTDIRIARVDFGPREYAEPNYCACSIRLAAKRYRFSVKVTVRNQEVYLIKD